jgi:hypothetical protein
MREMENELVANRQMPQYRCHKKVWALKIGELREPVAGDPIEMHSVLVPADALYAAFGLTGEYMAKHKPQAGGYWVQYEDGYESYSPAKAFEEGYALIAAMPAAAEHILQFFNYAHLPAHLAQVSSWFAEVGNQIMTLPRNPERTVALRKLLESKDAAVRARLAKD